jgi:hypothetical protein
MNFVKKFQNYIFRIAIMGIILSLFLGCATGPNVHIQRRSGVLEAKFQIPLDVALVLPDSLKAAECINGDFVFDCGAALHDSILITLKTFFINTEAVSNKNRKNSQYDRSIYFIIEKLKIAKEACWIHFNYRVVDNQNNETFSSSLNSDLVRVQQSRYLLAYNETDFRIDSGVNREMMLATVPGPIPVPVEEIWEWYRTKEYHCYYPDDICKVKNLFEHKLFMLMYKLYEELTGAYSRGEL